MKLTRRPLGWQEPEGADRQTTEPEQSITQTPERDPEKEQTMNNELKEKLINWVADKREACGSSFTAAMSLQYMFRLYTISVLHLSFNEYKSAWNEVKKMLDI